MKNAALLRSQGLRAKKSFGQNFLEDRAALERIAALCDVGPGHRHVVEIGAGLGALTAALAERGAHVFAMERDRDLAPLLRARFSGRDDVEILEANALVMDLRVLADKHGPLTVCGNLPYHLTSPLVFRALDQLDAWRRLVVMVQREVADRMVAGPGSRTYGLLSVMLQARLRVQKALDVPPGAFHPPPKVHSAVVVMTPRADPPVGAELPQYRALARAAFAGRRKTLRNGLKALLGDPAALLERAGVDGGVRAETLDVKTFARLARCAAELGLASSAPPPGEPDDDDA
ncbi:MAG: ribosomal RNA small subunit methyltransferase A [Deltaproteobacteria bacterium]|nr:ribosomal RNA small subunit methyltransferase A [Deltaproteobacteria bacterium]